MPRQPDHAPSKPRKAAVVPTRRGGRADGEVTRKRVIDAAVECILERGYYRASSNAIARQAGVTWGTIQHQFGSRERLLLEVLKEGWGAIQAGLRTATVTGATLDERLDSVFDVLARWYGVPEHLAHVQILLDLSSDPTTSESARAAALDHGKAISQAWRPLFVQAMGEAGTDRQLVEYAFLTFRGFLSANQFSASFATTDTTRRFRPLVVRGVAMAIAEQAKDRGLSTG